MATATFYPDANPETTSVDGMVNLTGTVWATVHDATIGGAADPTGLYFYVIARISGSTYRIDRGLILFDTSSLGAGAVVSAATLSLYGEGKLGTSGRSYNIYSSTPATNTDLITDDYEQVGTTAFSTAITQGNWNTGTPGTANAFALNASGIAAIDVTGISKFSLREVDKDVGNVAPTDNIYISSWSADKGTTYRPSLLVTYTAGATSQSVGGASMTPSTILALESTISKAVSSGLIAIAGALTRANTFYRNIGGASLAISSILSSVKAFSQVVGSASLAIAGALSRVMVFSQAVGGAASAIAGTLTRAVTFARTVGGASLNIASSLSAGLLIAQVVGEAAMTIAGTLSTIFHDIVEAVKTRWHFPTRSYDGTQADEIEGYGTASDEIEGYGTPQPRYKFPSDYE